MLIKLYRSEKKKKQREISEKEELNKCTFAPQLKKSLPNGIQYPSTKFIKRNSNWVEEKNTDIKRMKERESKKETEGCTFAPRINSASNEPRKVDNIESTKFYQKNIQWAEDVKQKVVNKIGAMFRSQVLIVHLKKKKNVVSKGLIEVPHSLDSQINALVE